MIIRKPELLQKVIKETIGTIWGNTTIGNLTDVGHQKRICFTVDGQPAMLDIYQEKDRTTTFRAVGKNAELINKINRNCSAGSRLPDDLRTPR